MTLLLLMRIMPTPGRGDLQWKEGPLLLDRYVLGRQVRPGCMPFLPSDAGLGILGIPKAGVVWLLKTARMSRHQNQVLEWEEETRFSTRDFSDSRHVRFERSREHFSSLETFDTCISF